LNSSSDGPFSFDSRGRIDTVTGTVFTAFAGLTAVKASTGDVCGVSVVATGSDVRIDFLEQQDPIGSILEK
jgi:hypothetical protein